MPVAGQIGARFDLYIAFGNISMFLLLPSLDGTTSIKKNYGVINI